MAEILLEAQAAGNLISERLGRQGGGRDTPALPRMRLRNHCFWAEGSSRVLLLAALWFYVLSLEGRVSLGVMIQD